MTTTATLVVELVTEELPPKALKRLGEAFTYALQSELRKRDFITEDGFHITPKCRTYLSPLIQGEAPPPYKNGLPDYVKLKNTPVPKKLPPFKI